MFSSSEISQTASGLFSAYASLTGFLMLFRSMFNDFMPEKLRSYFTDLLERLFTPKSTNMTMIIDEKFGVGRNQVFDAAEIYLHTKVSPKTERLRVGKTQRQKHFTVTVDKGEEISDKFENMEFKWRLIETDSNENRSREKYFELVFDKSVRDKVMDAYLPHVLSKSDEIKKSLRAVKLYSRDIYSSIGDDDGGDCGNGDWGHVNLEHPSTFDTLAMDLETRKMIIEDLERFLRRRNFYKRVGKAWKRGYLLYGPPGTGKSSLIAAMANHLKFDVYDLELSSVYSNSELKRLLLSTTNRSILVIEDIDCTKEVRDRGAEDQDDSDRKVTLSGILNFIDGLWSSCGDERIIIFTTNHKERLDPALLRPGRMDVHINMSYCTLQGFRILVSNYLSLDGVNHPLCQDIEPLIESQQVTPAEVAEELMKNDDADIALRGLLGFLEGKKMSSSSGKKLEDGKKMDVLNRDDDERIDGRKKQKAKKERKGRGKNRGRR